MSQSNRSGLKRRIIGSHITRLVLQPFFGERVVLNDCFERQCLLRVEQFRGWTHVPIPTVFSDGDLQRLSMPTLLLVGEHDIFYNPQVALARARRLLPNLEAELIPRVGHALPMEQPAVVDARILQFLGQGQELEAASESAEPRVAVDRLPIGHEA